MNNGYFNHKERLLARFPLSGGCLTSASTPTPTAQRSICRSQSVAQRINTLEVDGYFPVAIGKYFTTSYKLIGL